MMNSIHAIIKQGHKIASGQADNSPYPAGSITMQAPHFKAHGINLGGYYPATLNLSITPHTFKIIAPEFTVYAIHWAEGFEAEDFSFSKCEIIVNNERYRGLVYYPHPETKLNHFHSASIIEVISPYIPNIHYGDQVIFKYNPAEISIR